MDHLNKKMMVRFATTDSLSLTFSALAHPVRRRMLSFLKRGQASVKDLAKPFDMSPPAITKHLKVLENAGLIKRSSDAQIRFSEISADPMKEVRHWIESIDQYKQIWEDRLDNLEDLAKEELTKRGDKKKK